MEPKFIIPSCIVMKDICITVEPLSVFLDPSFNFYGPWANPISTMAPVSIVFPDPLFLFQTPDENDE
jgi:hypothetical protein